jgi:hypothetical protein
VALPRELFVLSKGGNMNRYETSTPRAALGLTAIAMAAISMMTLVVLPAELGSVSANTSMLAAEKDSTEARFDVATAPVGIASSGIVDPEDGISPGRATFDAQECGRQHRPNLRGLSD